MKGQKFSSNQMGSVPTNFLMTFFAFQSVSQLFSSTGPLFQTWLASLKKVDCTNVVFPNSRRSPVTTDLVRHEEASCTTFSILRGWFMSWTAFQTSVIFICAFIWFTDNMLTLVNNFLVLILSTICTPLSNLTILFCTFWIALKSPRVDSSFVHLTLPRSCRPYRILDVKMLSATFFKGGPSNYTVTNYSKIICQAWRC